VEAGEEVGGFVARDLLSLRLAVGYGLNEEQVAENGFHAGGWREEKRRTADLGSAVATQPTRD